MISKESRKTQRFLMLILIGLAGIGLVFAFVIINPGIADTLCGEGSIDENYGFSYDLQQPHWTIDWEPYVSEAAVNEVDVILDDLDYDNVVQTMILFKPAKEVGNRVNCAVHFLRYMKLGQPSGERKDNGFVFLIVVDDSGIDVHYGVGLGLPALTAQELTPLNRLAEDTFESTGSFDEALLSLVREYDNYVRSVYEPLSIPTSTPVEITLPTLNSVWEYFLCCLVIVIVLIILVILLCFMPRSGGGGGWHIPRGRGGGWSSPSGGFNLPRMRGGGGSGRSNRGN